MKRRLHEILDGMARVVRGFDTENPANHIRFTSSALASPAVTKAIRPACQNIRAPVTSRQYLAIPALTMTAFTDSLRTTTGLFACLRAHAGAGGKSKKQSLI
jgi:hypothetical protein